MGDFPYNYTRTSAPLQDPGPRRDPGVEDEKKESASFRPASGRRLRWLDGGGPPVRFQAINGHGLLPLANLQPDNFRAGGENPVWAAVERRQGRDGAALADIDERR